MMKKPPPLPQAVTHLLKYKCTREWRSTNAASLERMGWNENGCLDSGKTCENNDEDEGSWDDNESDEEEDGDEYDSD